MMDFDQMMETWKSQDDKPLYGINRDLLQLVLRQEGASIRRTLRLEQWTTYIVGTAMTAFAGAVLWWFLNYRGQELHAVAAAVGMGAFALWIAALWLSRRRQVLRERRFGNTLDEEIRRNLSLVDYQLSQVGRWSIVMLWSAPILVGAGLILWLGEAINGNMGPWYAPGMIVFLTVSIGWTTYDSSRRARQQLLPQKQRLSVLLEMLNSN